MTKPRVTELAKAAGISKTYASDILAGKQPPSRPLAIHILKSTGWRHDRLADLTDADIDALSSVGDCVIVGSNCVAGASVTITVTSCQYDNRNYFTYVRNPQRPEPACPGCLCLCRCKHHLLNALRESDLRVLGCLIR
jgi:hypothetical protein